MMGKVLGIGLVAITQILIWGVILSLCTLWVVPAVGASVSAGADAELVAAVSQLSDFGYIASLFTYMLLFFVGGYLFYSAIYAAIGSAVDNIQDASQLSTIPTLPIIISLVASMSVMQNPGSSLAFLAFDDSFYLTHDHDEPHCIRCTVRRYFCHLPYSMHHLWA